MRPEKNRDLQQSPQTTNKRKDEVWQSRHSAQKRDTFLHDNQADNEGGDSGRGKRAHSNNTLSTLLNKNQPKRDDRDKKGRDKSVMCAGNSNSNNSSLL